MAAYVQSFFDILVHGEDEMRRLNLMAGILIGLAPIVHLIVVSGINVPYGRYASASWGSLIHPKLAWLIQELPAFVIPSFIYINTDTSKLSLAAFILISCFLIHYFNRTFIYSMSIKGGKPTPLLILLLGFTFCTYNGYMQAMLLIHYSNYKPEYILEWNFIIGMLIFWFGFYTNNTGDSILRSLRKPGSTGYKIPHGGMFECVCAANLWGEAVEWVGWALAAWTLQGFAYATFAVLYLSARSYSHHVWYLKKFDVYPKDRRIFIPYLI